MAQKFGSIGRKNILFLRKILKSSSEMVAKFGSQLGEVCRTGVVLVMAFLMGSAHARSNERSNLGSVFTTVE